MAAKIRIILTNSILVILSLAFSIAIAEIICRIIPFSNDSDPTYKLTHDILPYSMKPNSESTSIHGNLIKINSHGLRDHEYSYEKEEDTFRILVLGDSIEFGLGAKMEDGYTKVLENQLNALANKKYKVIEIINAGHPLFNTLDRYNYLRLYGLKYSPDLLIVSLNSTNFSVGSSSLLVIDGITYSPGSTFSLPPRVKRFLRKSHLYIATGWWITKLRQQTTDLAAPVVNKKALTEKLEATQNYLDNFIAAGLNNKFPVYFAFMAIRHEVMSKTIIAPEFYEQIEIIAQEEKTLVINMLEPLSKFSDKTDDIFAHKDPSHLNTKGHKIIADHLFHKLAAHVQ
jgi:lysophospholipase L1-like esterase